VLYDSVKTLSGFALHCRLFCFVYEAGLGLSDGVHVERSGFAAHLGTQFMGLRSISPYRRPDHEVKQRNDNLGGS